MERNIPWGVACTLPHLKKLSLVHKAPFAQKGVILILRKLINVKSSHILGNSKPF